MSSFIDNLINVIGKANSAINSIKGIESKIARLNYDNLIDALGEAATEAREELAERRKALEDQVSSATKVNEGWYEGNDTKNPIVLTYPQHDLLETISSSLQDLEDQEKVIFYQQTPNMMELQ